MGFVKVEMEDGSHILLPMAVADAEEEVGAGFSSVSVSKLFAQVQPFVRQLRAQLVEMAPSTTTVRFTIGAALDGGVITSVFGGPSAEFGVEVELEWSRDGS
jgi:hypothetical protein